MTRLVRWWLVIALACVPLWACDKDEPDDSDRTNRQESSADWPEQPADGTPVVMEFQEMVGEGDDLGARMIAFNYSEQAVQHINLELHYQNEAGEDLDTFPFSIASGEVVGASGQVSVEVGVFVPPETVRIEAVVQEVRYADGTSWTRPE